ENLARSVDPAAVVYDAAAGVIRTSRLPGWVEDPAVPIVQATKFRPMPVRVIFGSTVRPRTDVPFNSPPPPPLTGSDGGGATRVPVHALADEATFFRRVFRRAGPGAPVRVDPAQLSGHDLGNVVTLRHPELVELIPLKGE